MTTMITLPTTIMDHPAMKANGPSVSALELFQIYGTDNNVFRKDPEIRFTGIINASTVIEFVPNIENLARNLRDIKARTLSVQNKTKSSFKVQLQTEKRLSSQNLNKERRQGVIGIRRNDSVQKEKIPPTSLKISIASETKDSSTPKVEDVFAKRIQYFQNLEAYDSSKTKLPKDVSSKLLKEAITVVNAIAKADFNKSLPRLPEEVKAGLMNITQNYPKKELGNELVGIVNEEVIRCIKFKLLPLNITFIQALKNSFKTLV